MAESSLAGSMHPGRAYERRWTRTTTAWFVALLAWATLVSFYHLNGGEGFEPTDAWVAQTTREMLDTGEWIVPHFAGEPFLQKSPGPYWAVSLVAWLRGTPVDDVAARTPNAVAGVILVATLFLLTRRIAGDRAAVFAGFAAASSLFILYWTHRANAELGVACLVAVALACFWMGAATAPGWKRGALWLLGYFAAGLGMLYKMPMPLACVGLPALAYIVLQRRWRLLLSGWHLAGLLVFLAAWLPWVLAVCVQEPTALAKWRVEFVDRFTGDMPNVQEHKVWYFYFLYLLPPVLFCLPYSLSLPGAIVRGFRRDERFDRDGMRFMLIWFFSLLAFFTVATGKEIRYFLPALPPLFVLLGCELAEFFDPQSRRAGRPRLERILAMTAWVAVTAVTIGGGFALKAWNARYALGEWSDVRLAYTVAVAVLSVGVGLTAWLYAAGRRQAAFGALVATMGVFWAWTWPEVMSRIGAQKPSLDFAKQLRDDLPVEHRSRLRNVGFHDPRIVWLTDIRYPRVFDQLKLLDLQGGRRTLAYERRVIGEEMVRQLEQPELVLFVATRPDYILFLVEARQELEKLGRAMPSTHLWMQTRCGPKARHVILFGNQPPPWKEPALEPPSERLSESVSGRIVP